MKKSMFLLALLSLFISGCVFNQEGQEQVKEQPTRPINVKNSVIENVDRKTGQEISEHLVELASQVPEVNDATAVVIGPYAIVGIDVKEDLNRTEVGSVKYSVAESLKHDPNGKNALIVADPDITARLRHIAIDIDKGEPIEGILNELGEIVGRLLPELPADIHDPAEKELLEKQKDQLNKEDKQNLEKEQQEQSNHHKN